MTKQQAVKLYKRLEYLGIDGARYGIDNNWISKQVLLLIIKNKL